MNKFKVEYTLGKNKDHYYSIIEGLHRSAAVTTVRNSINEMYPEDDFEYISIDEYDEDVVQPGGSFIENGKEYSWEERVAGPIHVDFDNWAVWKAFCNDDATVTYFIVDEDTGFIDWEDENKEAAIEFMNGKLEDEEDTQLHLEEDLDKEEEDSFTISAMVKDLIKDEYEAISGYDSAIVTIKSLGDSYQPILDILTDIEQEENVHIGQLQKIMELVDENSKLIQTGTEEAEKQLEETEEVGLEDERDQIEDSEN